MTWIKGSRWGNLPCQMHQGIIQLKLDRKDISAFSRELVNAGADIVAINPRNSLEEYFLKITGRDQYAGADQDRAF